MTLTRRPTPAGVAPATLLLALSLGIAAACGGPAPSPSAPGLIAPSPSASVDAPSPSSSIASASPTASASAAAASPSAPAASPTPAATLEPTPAPTREPTAPPPVETFPQTWAGTWVDPVTGGAGSLQLVLTGKGGDFGGSITMDGTACLADGILSGRYDGSEIVFTVTQRDVDLSFVGEASDAGIGGTFTSTCEGMDGTWAVQRSGR